MSSTVTILFTDIVDSTGLVLRLGALYPDTLAAHHSRLRAAVQAVHGSEIYNAGDGFFQEPRLSFRFPC